MVRAQMMGQFREEGHLGGYIIGGDPATYYPDLWTWLVNDYGVKSVLDVGCGEGHSLAYFREVCGISGQGIDGVDQNSPFIWTHDYMQGPLDLSELQYDLVWCCEFVEHVEEQFIPNFLLSLVAGDLILMTHAEPGQQGWHHVNCRTQDYWKGVMAALGFRFDEMLTQTTRELASRSDSPYNHYARSGLAFLAPSAIRSHPL